MPLTRQSALPSPLRASQLLLACAYVLCLLACTPTFDWRSQTASTHGDTYRLEYPGKPLSAQKSVVLADQTVLLTLTGVQTPDAQFVLGHVPAANAAQAKLFATALAQSFALNLSKSASAAPAAGALVAAPALKPIAVARTEGAFEYQATIDGKTALARFAWTRHAAYELLAVGKTSALPSDTAEQFVRSIQFEP